MDHFQGYASNLTSPARDALAVLPSDTADLPVMTRALYVGQAGHVQLTMAGGQSVTFLNLQPGSMLPVRASRVQATGTTAAGIIALW